ncbi:hypothetical protein ETAA8_17320 [Anatilimnocola aggregata]|uniref:Uncharacterized protein n=1 Tax=Anatilimnocola aggregata TaxID=2528021 RepID=A0A517Y8W7_9BACT|nr:hypothetical protein ETAA8_17320 [Anatilimnocola aggregata]
MGFHQTQSNRSSQTRARWFAGIERLENPPSLYFGHSGTIVLHANNKREAVSKQSAHSE